MLSLLAKANAHALMRSYIYSKEFKGSNANHGMKLRNHSCFLTQPLMAGQLQKKNVNNNPNDRQS